MLQVVAVLRQHRSGKLCDDPCTRTSRAQLSLMAGLQDMQNEDIQASQWLVKLTCKLVHERSLIFNAGPLDKLLGEERHAVCKVLKGVVLQGERSQPAHKGGDSSDDQPKPVGVCFGCRLTKPNLAPT